MASIRCLKVILLAILLAAVFDVKANLTPDEEELIRQYAATCHRELGGDMPEDFGNRMIYEPLVLTSEVAMCTIQCIFVKRGYTDEAGLGNAENIMAIFTKNNSPDEVKLLLERCAEIGGDTKCERAYQLHLCYHKHRSVLTGTRKL